MLISRPCDFAFSFTMAMLRVRVKDIALLLLQFQPGPNTIVKHPYVQMQMQIIVLKRLTEMQKRSANLKDPVGPHSMLMSASNGQLGL